MSIMSCQVLVGTRARRRLCLIERVSRAVKARQGRSPSLYCKLCIPAPNRPRPLLGHRGGADALSVKSRRQLMRVVAHSAYNYTALLRVLPGLPPAM